MVPFQDGPLGFSLVDGGEDVVSLDGAFEDVVEQAIKGFSHGGESKVLRLVKEVGDAVVV
jgi:hypothetical protein